MGNLFPLRPLQERAIQGLRESLRAGKRRSIIQAPTGFGKTIVASHIVDGALKKQKRVAFCVPSLSLIDQTFERMVENGIDPSDIGVMQADHPWRRPNAPVQICSLLTVKSRGYPDVDFVIVDECFAAGTMVLTPSGEVPIETLKRGDEVVSAFGRDVILGVSERAASILRIKLSNGRTIDVTRNHRFFTSAGWRYAHELEARSRLFCEEAVRSLWSNVWAKGNVEPCSARIRVEPEDILLRILLEEEQSPDEQTVSYRQNESVFDGTRSSAEVPWREWKWNDCSAEETSGNAGVRMGGRNSDTYEGGVSKWNLPALLQAGFMQSSQYDRHRGRRVQSQRSGEGSRPEEGLVNEWVRVENIEDIEQRCAVYNIHVARHPSYFANGVLVHNCHLRYSVIDNWIDDHPDKIFIGLTATPWSKGLGDRFNNLIIPTSIAELTEQGWLTPLRAFAPSKPDLSDVKIVAGDYHNGQLSEKMSGKSIVGDVVSTWLDKAENRPTMVFAVDRAHADKLHVEFSRMGVRSAYVDANTPREERNEILRDLNSGLIRVICSVSTMTTGIDADIRCISFCRPTKSEILWVQSIGRGLRTAEGKKDCILLDHSGTALSLGLPAEITHMELRTSTSERGEREKKAPKEKCDLPIECMRCDVLIPVAASECPNCGWRPRRTSPVHVEEGDLLEIGGSKNGGKTKISKLSFYAQLKGYALEMGFKPQWATAKFKAKLDEWPHHSIKNCEPIRCENKVRSWIRADFIRWKKGQEKQKDRQQAWGGGQDNA